MKLKTFMKANIATVTRYAGATVQHVNVYKGQLEVTIQIKGVRA